ncbi:MAG: putative baseplate assembly protein [Chloroflexota bacterium]|jgi:predicted phage baseplate assembly protein
MALVAPKLDDRSFQDIVDEAKKRIPHYCKEWTDHNVSDPGVTLIELFAWMTDIVLYRMNQVPDLHYIKFMEMLGIRLQEPVPASAPVTFYLSAPQETPMVIPGGTQVASTQTETESSIIFTTDDSFRVVPPDLQAVITRVSAGSGSEKQYRAHNVRRLEGGFEGFEVFSEVPQTNDALYFGFENDLSMHILGLEMDHDPAGGAGIDPTMPPYVWEASSGDRDERWRVCDVEMDSTKGLNVPGMIQVHLPRMGRYSINKKSFYWLRARIKDISPAEEEDGMRPYQVSPKLLKVTAASWGGTTPATHASVNRNEFIGRSDGSAGQRFQVQQIPVLSREPGENLTVQVEGEPPQQWTEVNDFADSGATDRHFVMDSVSGEVRLGPAVRQRDGTIKLYGAIPPRGANLIFRRYRNGGGDKGNVQVGILNTLKTSIPYISRVTNRKPAWGGMDAESLESAMTRAPSLLRSRDRAVTESDFEFLARQALPAGTSRVKCLQPRPAEAGRVAPGQIYVLVIPKVMNPNHYIRPDELELDDSQMKLLSEYLDERRLLTTRLDIRAPAFRWVSVTAELRESPGFSQEEVEAEVLARLYRYLNPLVGGPRGEGWPFGRDLFVSDVYQSLQGAPNVQFIRSVRMYLANEEGAPEGDQVENVEVVSHGVIASGIHRVEFV